LIVAGPLATAARDAVMTLTADWWGRVFSTVIARIELPAGMGTEFVDVDMLNV
jgi:hypothetical protein